MRRVILAAILASAPNAHAEDLKWSGARVGLLSVDFDQGIPDGNGGGISGSLAAGDVAYVFGSLIGYTIEDTPIHVTENAIGFGAHADFASNSAVYGEFASWRSEVEDTYTGGAIDGDGTSLSVGFRHMPNNHLEVNASFGRSTSDSESTNAFGLGVRVYLIENAFFFAGITNGEHSTTTSAGVGAAF